MHHSTERAAGAYALPGLLDRGLVKLDASAT